MIIVGQNKDVITCLGPGDPDILRINNTEIWEFRNGAPAHMLGKYNSIEEARDVISEIATEYDAGTRRYDLPQS